MICLFSLIISAQQKKTYGKVSIKTPYGYLFISNSSEKSFTLEIRGKEIEVINEGNNRIFIVDEKLLNIVQADTKDFVSANEKLTEEQILEKHKIWESEYRRQAFNWVGPDKTDREWLLWIKRRLAKAALRESRALAISSQCVLRNQTASRIGGGIRSVGAAKSS